MKTAYARIGGLLASCALGVGCGPSTGAETQWLRWFSDVSFIDAARTPQGETVVVGYSALNPQLDEFPLHQEAAERPFIARVDASGEVLHEWIGFLGRAQAVATDDQGRAYVMVGSLPETADSFDVRQCEVRALDAEGEVRWAMDWDCLGDVEVVDDVLVATAERRVEGFDLEGNPQWRAELSSSSFVHFAVDDGGVWWARNDVTSMSNRLLAWRADVHTGEVGEIELDMPGWMLGSTRSLDGGVLAVLFGPPGAVVTEEIVLASFASDGRVRWTQRIDEEELWRWSLVGLTDRGAPWLVGTEEWDDPSAEHSARDRRIIVQRWGEDGAREEALRYGFTSVEPGTPAEGAEVLDPTGCQLSDAPIRGSWAYQGLAHDDQLLVVGRQDCRDSFLLNLRMPW